jgi:hypothetical protein
VVDVETRIHKLRGCLQVFYHAALLSGPGVVLPDELLEELRSRWKLQMLVDVACEVAFACPPIEFHHEAFVKSEDDVPVGCIGGERNVHLQVTVADDSVVKVYTREIVVCRVSGADELFDDESARPAITFGSDRQTAAAMYGMYTPA